MNSGREPAWPAVLYGLLTAVACVFAFVGLSASGYWADELFTVYVIAPGHGLDVVLGRALGDVHPPLYYFLLHAWSRLAGVSEWALRLPSAVCSVLALGVFALGARKVASGTAVAFACAVASGSIFWFGQTQNARSYGLVMLIAAGMLAAALKLRRQWRERSGFPLSGWLLLSLLGLAGSQTHSYLLLACGMLLLFLLLTLRELRLQLALVASGLAILAAYLGFLWFLWHASDHDFQHTWFRSDFAFMAGHLRRAVLRSMGKGALAAVAVLLLVALVRRRGRERAQPQDDAAWAAALCGFVVVGTVICGMAVSRLVAPSFSDRNVLTCVPFAWLLIARLYDVAGPRARSRGGAALVVLVALLLGMQLSLLRGRLLPTNETWRAAGEYVGGLASCAGRPLPVLVRPESYGLATPTMRHFVGQSYFGYYLPATFRPQVYLPDELLAHYAAAGAVAPTCPVLAWNEHDMGESDALPLAMRLARTPGLAMQGVLLQEFVLYRFKWLGWERDPTGFVFLRGGLDSEAPRATGTAAGDRLRVRYLGPAPAGQGTYSLRRELPDGSVREQRVVAAD